MILKSLCVILALSVSASAKVGEFYLEFIKRTGFERADEPSIVPNLAVASHENQSGIKVTVYVFNGRICAEKYARVSKEQAVELLKKQSDGWKQTRDDSESEWRATGLVAAYFLERLIVKNPDGEKLLVELTKAETERREQKEKRKTDGF